MNDTVNSLKSKVERRVNFNDSKLFPEIDNNNEKMALLK
eukprot:CAMPEP_0168319352 /NCGR_PEP_ID=MMETSP0213-20121227/1004_1 /TAXON_ID=151035 /ORGANISM="Euplotes harpa, Strain FSP1.4" /LENGTH=38 /DNA_ID= /DNA_START= /DNA_END= /DNA_ORIENTATION=